MEFIETDFLPLDVFPAANPHPFPCKVVVCVHVFWRRIKGLVRKLKKKPQKTGACAKYFEIFVRRVTEMPIIPLTIRNAVNE